ncbi:MAG: tetratricopeptide repeat protein [Desulfobacterales bacterium]|nr:tetratricopeptide repeat protein [Desulfobacterales bacterium]
MRKLTFLFIVTLTIGLAAIGLAKTSPPDMNINPEQALAFWDGVIFLDAKNADAFNNRGLVYRILGRYQRALEDFNQAIRLNP